MTRSYIVHYLRWLGYDLRGVRQTGSNFGEMVKHDTPFLSAVGSGTMVADGLSIINADFSNTSFRLSRVSIGAENFLGNRIAYPAQGKTGDNCLLATKVMVPLDGQVREGVGLLGAPSFEIPRSVKRDKQLDVESADELRRRLMAKNIHNTITMALFLLVQWIFFFAVTVLYLAAVDLWASLGALAFALATAGVFVFTVAYNVLVDRLVRPLMALRPQGCSIYDRAFWRHERFWKMSTVTYLTAFNGTPLKTVLWRLLGVRIGRRVFDDGAALVRADVHHDRRRLHAQRGQHYPVPLAGGRRIQVRPHRDRCRLHDRRRRMGPLRGDDGRRRGARRRLLPHEGRGNATERTVGRKPGQEDARALGRSAGPKDQHRRQPRRRARPRLTSGKRETRDEFDEQAG